MTESIMYRAFIKDVVRLDMHLCHGDNILSDLVERGVLHSLPPTPSSLRASIERARTLFQGSTPVWFEWEAGVFRLCMALFQEDGKMTTKKTEMVVIGDKLWTRKSVLKLVSPRQSCIDIPEWIKSFAGHKPFPLYSPDHHDPSPPQDPILDSGMLHKDRPERADLYKCLQTPDQMACWIEHDPDVPWPDALLVCSAWLDPTDKTLIVGRFRTRRVGDTLERIGREEGVHSLYKMTVWATRISERKHTYPLMSRLAAKNLHCYQHATVLDLLQQVAVGKAHDLAYVLDKIDVATGKLTAGPTIVDEVLHPTGVVYNSAVYETSPERMALMTSLSTASTHFDASVAWYLWRDGTKYWLVSFENEYEILPPGDGWTTTRTKIVNTKVGKRPLRLSRDGAALIDQDTGIQSPGTAFFPDSLSMRTVCRWVEEVLDLDTGSAYPYCREEICSLWRSIEDVKYLARPFFVDGSARLFRGPVQSNLPSYLAHYGDQTFAAGHMKNAIVVHGTVFMSKDHPIPYDVAWGVASKSSDLLSQRSVCIVTGILYSWWDPDKFYGIKMYAHRLSHVLEIQLVLPTPAKSFAIWLHPTPDHALVSIVWGQGTYPDELARVDVVKERHPVKDVMLAMWGSNGAGTSTYTVS